MEDGGYLSYFPYFCTDYWRAGIHAGPLGLLTKVMERKHLILLIIWAWLLPCAHGQNVLPYKTQTIDGVEYYIYPVKRSEGLYRISVNFGVTQEEIIRLNPEVKDGLRAGQLLFIPKKTPQAQPTQQSTSGQTHTPPPVDLIAASLAGSHATPPPTASTPQPDNEPNFYYHKVLPKQTLYSLSKQYGVRQDDIIRYNPQAATGLRAGEVLRIPKPEDIYQDRKAAKQQEDLSVKYLIHRVQLYLYKKGEYRPGEGFDFGNSPAQLENVDLQGRSLRVEGTLQRLYDYGSGHTRLLLGSPKTASSRRLSAICRTCLKWQDCTSNSKSVPLTRFARKSPRRTNRDAAAATIITMTARAAAAVIITTTKAMSAAAADIITTKVKRAAAAIITITRIMSAAAAGIITTMKRAAAATIITMTARAAAAGIITITRIMNAAAAGIAARTTERAAAAKPNFTAHSS